MQYKCPNRMLWHVPVSPAPCALRLFALYFSRFRLESALVSHRPPNLILCSSHIYIYRFSLQRIHTNFTRFRTFVSCELSIASPHRRASRHENQLKRRYISCEMQQFNWRQRWLNSRLRQCICISGKSIKETSSRCIWRSTATDHLSSK